MFSRNLQRFLNHVLVFSAAMGIVASTAIAAFGSGNFQKTGSLNVARGAHTATLLSNGEVLVAGGDNSSFGGGYLSSAELYNPSTDSWTLTGTMTTARQSHQPLLLPNRQVPVPRRTNGAGHVPS